MNAAGVPVLLSRTDDGEVQAFFNMCSHRGAQIMAEGVGNTHRFTCPYHAWTYNLQGDLTAIYANKDFGDLDKQCHSLTPLPCLERAGLIWVTLNKDSTLSIDTFLSGYDALLSHFGFEDWHHFASQDVAGPNWKIAYDGYMDLYHLPILHKDTFGPDYPNRANYYNWGPHQRVAGPDPRLAEFKDASPEDWPEAPLLAGVWTIFPHISIASFEGGGRAVMLSQLFPGDTPGTSVTTQHYLMETAPDEAAAEAATEQFKFLKYVVQEEDYATGLRQQKALESGGKSHVIFGKNEAGGHHFHAWVDLLLNTNDEDLTAAFEQYRSTHFGLNAGA
jgi:phenylpropionate dioxygenase-like ring-hydroxylating dioxygenase large terminal subunit